MAYNAKYNKYKENYSRENYDRLQLVTPKGTREKLKTEADKRGLSVNALLNQIIAQILPPDPPKPSGEIPEDAERETAAPTGPEADTGPED